MTVRDFDARNSENRARVLKQTEEQRQNGTYEWSCGHKAGAMCLECWGELARKANKLVEELDVALDALNAIAGGYDEAGQVAIEALRRIREGSPNG